MKKSILSIVAMLALAGMANAGSVVFSNFGGTFAQIQADGVAIPAGTGFVAVGTSSLTPQDLAADVAANGGSQLSTAGLALLASSFDQFGDDVTFGFNNAAGYFEGNGTGNGGTAAFNGNPILLVAGNGTDIASSTSLLIVAGTGNFGPDAPTFSANVTPEAPNTIIFGAAGGTNTLSANFTAVQMGNVGDVDVIPEPGVSILALLSAGIIFLRRRR